MKKTTVLISKTIVLYNEDLAVPPPCHLDLGIKLLLVEHVEAFLAFAYNKTNYHTAFFTLYRITTKPEDSLKRVIDFDNLC